MKKVLVACLKGGVGKTSTSIGLARALNSQGKKVGILDLDYRTPNVPVAMDDGVARLSHKYEGDVLIPPEIEGIKVMSMAYIWPEDKCVLVEDSSAMDDVLHLLTPGIIDWGEVEYLIIDTPPTSVGVVKVAMEVEELVGAVVVTHASKVARMDAKRTLDLFKEKRVPIIGIVCNQSEGEDGTPRYDLSVRDIQVMAEEYRVRFLASIPHVNGDRSGYYDIVARAVLDGKVVRLERKEPRGAVWTKLMSIGKKFSVREDS